MICVGFLCDECKNEYDDVLNPGHRPYCLAFPNGIPIEHYRYSGKKDLTNCNNGIGFEPKEVRDGEG